jgi:hypothetical protein
LPKKKSSLGLLSILCVAVLSSCSPRDFLTRRLASDLIAGANVFKTPEQFWLRTGIVSNKDYPSTDYLLLQHRGWLTASNAPCPPQIAPPPCWDVVLTPAGVETVRNLISSEDAERPAFSVPAARRELVAITGISKSGNIADVNFTWRWIPLNEFGAAMYASDLHFTSTAGFRYYDDGWRVVQSAPRSGQTLEDALKNAEPAR